MSVLSVTTANFESEVLNCDKPVLLDFWASWCMPCMMMSPIIDEIARENANIKVGKVNVDEQGELAARFGIMTIPAFLVFKDGKLQNQVSGVMPKESILKLL